MNRIKETDHFEKSLRHSLESAELTPAPQVWSKIEASLDSAAQVSPWRNIAMWSGAVAASVIIAIALNLIFAPNISFESYETMISSSEFIEFEKSPILMEPANISMPQLRFIEDNNGEDEIIETSEASEASEAFEIFNDLEEVKDIEIKDDFKTETSLESNETNNANKGNKEIENNTPSLALSKANSATIDADKILGKKRTRRYTTSAAILALAAGGVSTIDFNSIFTSATTTYSGTAPSGDFSGEFNNAPTSPTLDNENIDDKNYRPSNADHHMPISYVLSVAKRLNERWSLESGVSYTHLTSDITMVSSSNEFTQRVQYIGIPLRVNYDIYATEKFSFYMGAGGQIEHCISATINRNDFNEHPWHASAEAALGVQYKISRWLGIYAEPELLYYFTPSKLTTIRTETPLSLNLRCGLRFIL
ncbi:MAG: hypothetical protein SNG38_02180 [Rikenellaceae bacterium]